VAWASIGCWSNSARSSPLWKNPFEPTDRNEPASDVWTLTSQRSVLRPVCRIAAVVHAAAAEDQRVRQIGIRVGDHVFEPLPVFGCGICVALHQFRRERFAKLVRTSVAAQPPKVFVNADERERPRTRRSEPGCNGKGLLEELRR